MGHTLLSLPPLEKSTSHIISEFGYDNFTVSEWPHIRVAQCITLNADSHIHMRR